MTQDICEELADLLGSVRRPGDFFASGRLELLTPRLTVEGVGQIALPLLPAQAAQLIAVAQRAPYGRGAETLVDTSVRRTWQIGPDRVRLGGKHWEAALERIVALAAEGLGIDEPVSARLYKLLIYDAGSFFVGHRDTEKEPGMFATLVLALPSLSSGGELLVRHDGREVKLDLAGGEPSELAFAAFYADCVHEVLPVTAGCRATLVYNLVRKGKGAMPGPPSYAEETARAVALLQEWVRRKGSAGDDTPEKVVYPLEHAYSAAELDFAKLKGADAAAAALLKSAAPQAGCDLHLALISIGESGMAEHSGSYRSRYDDDEFEVVEVHDRWEDLTEWRRPDGVAAGLGKIPVEDGEVSPPDALEDMEPDEEHFHEATGNEGASFERSYRRAALVLWPQLRRLAVLNQAGLGATLPYLESLAARWIAEGAKPDAAPWTEAHELAGHMLDSWPEEYWYASADDDVRDIYDDEDEDEDVEDRGIDADEYDEDADGEEDADDESGDGESDGEEEVDDERSLARVLAALAKLRDETRIAAALDRLTASRGHDRADNDAILAAVALFPRKRAAQTIEAIVKSHAAEALGACCGLLEKALAGPFAAERKQLANAAGRLVGSLPGDPARAPADQWGRRRHVVPGAAVVVDLVRIAEAVDAALAQRLAAHLLAWPQTYGVDRALVPAVKRLIGGGAKRSGAATERLHAACLAHLEARAAEPLEAPADWSRASGIKCRCEHCAALASFLASPVTETWRLKAAERIRGHVEGEIKTARADVDVRIERRGSPHTLICRKNSASYERRVVQRRQDLADIAVLKATPPVA